MNLKRGDIYTSSVIIFAVIFTVSLGSFTLMAQRSQKNNDRNQELARQMEMYPVEPVIDTTDNVTFSGLVPQGNPVSIFLLGDSSYIYNDGVIVPYLQNYLSPALECGFTISIPSAQEFEDSNYRIWGYNYDDNGAPIDRDINTVPIFMAAKAHVSEAVNNNQVPLVVIGFGTNESKDILNPNTGKTMDKFHSYLGQAVSILESLGATVLVATPTKGCPFPNRNYYPDGMLAELAGNIKEWYPDAADIFTAFQNYYCSNTDPCPGPGECQTRCLINVDPYNSPGFPDRTCSDDYCHPNHEGYTLMSDVIANLILSEDICPEEPTNTPIPSPTPSAIPTDVPPGFCSEDVNTDHYVNLIDVNRLINYSTWNSGCDNCREDVNQDGRVSLPDLSMVINYVEWNGWCEL